MIRARTGSAQYSVSQQKMERWSSVTKTSGMGRQWSLVIGGQILVLPFTSFLQYGQSFYVENGGCLQFSKIYAIFRVIVPDSHGWSW